MVFTEAWKPWLGEVLYQNKYRTESLRLRNWDYSNIGWYYVTICSKEKKCYFGSVVNGKMVLNKLGEIVQQEWFRIQAIRKGVELDEFVIMPNHIHGIIVIKNDHIDNNVEAHGHAPLQIKQNLSNIVRGFKGSVTNKIRTSLNQQFSWQPNFHEHIIRNDKTLFQIRKYIQLNPLKWEIDKENPINN